MTALLVATHHGDGSPAWPWFPLIPLFFVALWVSLFFVAFRRRCWAGPRRSGESVLGERYARGEIDEAEYRVRLAVLRGKL